VSDVNVLCTSTRNTAKNGIGCFIVFQNQAGLPQKVHQYGGRNCHGNERKPETK